MKITGETLSLVRAALREDLGAAGDLTSKFFVPPNQKLNGYIVAKQPGVVCGTEIARKIFILLGCRVKILVKDGSRVALGRKIMQVSGGRALLTAERTALNFMQRLSGVATLTSSYSQKVKGTKAKIFDTRKTLPGWRALDKYAVTCGGGRNHRMGLYDMVLLKDNHWAAGMNVSKQVERFRKKHPSVPVELEAADFDQVVRALEAGADLILLDNMTPALIKKSIKLIRDISKAEIEISGNVTLKNVRAMAKLGPDRISIGRLTHSAPALDLSLEVGVKLDGANLVVHLTETDSTQTQARGLAEKGCPDKTIVWADRQTAGRGRLERKWESPDGNLYFSVVLRPTFAPGALAAYSLAAAEAVAAALRAHADVETAVKPPNDVYAVKDGEARKVCGILAEASGGQKTLDWLIVGVGVNVNRVPAHFKQATCLKCLTTKDWDVEKVLRAVWAELGKVS